MENRRVPSLRPSVLTLFGLGYVPGGATLASLVAVTTWLVVAHLNSSFAVSLTLFAAMTVWGMAALASTTVGGDPREVVLDEFLGMYAALLFVPGVDYRAALCLFVAFRILDILKVPPFSWIDRWRSPMAILLDDVAIGLFLGVLDAAIVSGWHP